MRDCNCATSLRIQDWSCCHGPLLYMYQVFTFQLRSSLWLRARLQHLQCISNGDTAVLQLTIDLHLVILAKLNNIFNNLVAQWATKSVDSCCFPLHRSCKVHTWSQETSENVQKKMVIFTLPFGQPVTPILVVMLLVNKGNQAYVVNTLSLRQSGSHFAENIFKVISFNEKFWVLNKVSLKYLP